MLYHLFQFELAGILGTIAVILTLICLVLFLATAGSSIRTSADGGKPSRFSASLRILMVLSANISVVMLASFMLGDYAIERASSRQDLSPWQISLFGPASIDHERLLQTSLLLGLGMFMVSFLLISASKQASPLRLWLDRFRSIKRQQEQHGSSHFATGQEFKRFIQDQNSGINLYGRFMGQKISAKKYTYLGDQFSLTAEDAARGMITIGNPGSGKSSSVILPILYDSMRLGQNLVVADPQFELTQHIFRYAAVSGHRVIVHNPLDENSPRYNLASNIRSISQARAIADVLIPKEGGGSGFWSKSAEMLLAACLLRFDNIGDIYTQFNDLSQLAKRLGEEADDAQRLAGSFISSAEGDGKLASNIVATLSTSLTGWADQTVRDSTTASDFKASDLVNAKRPTVIILASPGQARRTIAPYLGAVLTKLLLDLDSIGERSKGGALPVPVKFIIDEFPALGDLSAIVEFANLVRKRRIAFLLACQTLGQLENIYGKNGSETLLAGMATQIVFGGCDHKTAEFYSASTGQSTSKSTTKEGETKENQRRLLTSDEVVRPPQGNCLISTRYVEAEYATYALILARLTRIYERKDVTEVLALIDENHVPKKLLKRGRADRMAKRKREVDAQVAKEADDVIPEIIVEKKPVAQVHRRQVLIEPLGDFR